MFGRSSIDQGILAARGLVDERTVFINEGRAATVARELRRRRLGVNTKVRVRLKAHYDWLRLIASSSGRGSPYKVCWEATSARPAIWVSRSTHNASCGQRHCCICQAMLEGPWCVPAHAHGDKSAWVSQRMAFCEWTVPWWTRYFLIGESSNIEQWSAIGRCAALTTGVGPDCAVERRVGRGLH